MAAAYNSAKYQASDSQFSQVNEYFTKIKPENLPLFTYLLFHIYYYTAYSCKFQALNSDNGDMKTLGKVLCTELFAGFLVLAAAGPLFAAPVSVPDSILGQGVLTASDMAACLEDNNPELDPDFAAKFASLYIKEAAAEGVNADVAFSQMCMTTDCLKFDAEDGVKVSRQSNNFGGIGVSADDAGATFPSMLLGVRAHIQHLKAYATDAPLVQAQVDPRYWDVRFGCAPTVDRLGGTWSPDLAYGQKLKSQIGSLYTLAFGNTPTQPAASSEGLPPQTTLASWAQD
jgi:hypothetical protein